MSTTDLALRRELVRRHATLSGIDYLEVLDNGASTKALRQRTLLVHALKPLPPLTEANVRIAGGVRVTAKALWAARVADLPAGHGVPQAVLDALPDPDRVLVVRTDSQGDFSPYELELSALPDRFVCLTDFDPVLSRVTFSFKVECPSEFDCRPDAQAPPGALPQPLIDYMAKDYRSFRRLMLDRLALTIPQWKERSPADLGIAVVEVLAYAADHLSYYQDAVATEAYLGTARRRVSVRRHARLLDYPMHEGCNARAFLTVQTAADGVVLSGAGTRFLTQSGVEPAVHPDNLEKVLEQSNPAVFEPLHDIALYRTHNAIPFYTWTAESYALPLGATKATLLDDAAGRLRLCAGDVLIFEAAGNPVERHAVRLTKVNPEAVRSGDGGVLRLVPLTEVKDPLTDELVVEIEWDEQDALPFALPVAERIGGVPVTGLSLARGNVVLADHGLTVAAEALDTVPGGGKRYLPRLRRPDLTYSSPLAPGPACALIVQDPRKAAPAIRLHEGDQVWLPQAHLLGTDRFAREFVVELENDGMACLRFGDNTHGRRPDAGPRLKATYRVGNGPAGNVGAEAIAHVVTAEDVLGVRNPLPARGGTAPESAEQVRQYAPTAFRRQERAVTVADYAAAAERHPGVARAAATLRWTGSWHTMYVTVERPAGKPVDATFQAEVKAFLERFRLAGYDLEVDGPRYVSLEIALEVCVAPGYFREDVKQALLAEFSSGVLPDGRPGFFHPDRFSFGDPVYLSQIIARASEVPGVQWIGPGASGKARFRRWGRAPAGELEAGKILLGRLEIARLENDPSRPESGKLEFLVRGGL